jgi:ATP-binding cassette subfamily F protein uup
VNYLSVENISKSFENAPFKDVSFGINKDQKIALLPKTDLKTTIMNIINFDEPDTGQVILRKSIRMAFYLKTIISKTSLLSRRVFCI